MSYLRFKRFGLSVNKDCFCCEELEVTSMVGATLSPNLTAALSLLFRFDLLLVCPVPVGCYDYQCMYFLTEQYLIFSSKYLRINICTFAVGFSAGWLNNLYAICTFSTSCCT